MEVLFVCLLQPIVNGQSDPLAVIGAILDTVGIEYVPPPARPGTCRDCSRSTLARFGIDLTPTLPTNPCCTTTTAAPATTTTASGTTTTTAAGATTTTTAPTCKCGQEGTTRIVGGEQSMVGVLFYRRRSKGNISGGKIPVDHVSEFWVNGRIKPWRMRCHPGRCQLGHHSGSLHHREWVHHQGQPLPCARRVRPFKLLR